MSDAASNLSTLTRWLRKGSRYAAANPKASKGMGIGVVVVLLLLLASIGVLLYFASRPKKKDSSTPKP